MNLPNGTDTIELKELIPLAKDQKIEIDINTFLCLISDLEYLRGYCEAIELGLKYWKESGE